MLKNIEKRELFASIYSEMDQVKFVEDSLKKVLLGPFLNTVIHISLY